jgi:hypothetical protein
MSDRTCSVEGCDRPYEARGFCRTHYNKFRRHGDPLWTPPSHEERFWSRVEKGPDCWEWMGKKHPRDRYGLVRQYDSPGKDAYAHRLSFAMHFGSIPETLCVLHRCDNPPCVRPDHLFLGTRAENNEDKLQKRRHAYGSGHAHAKMTEEQILEIRAKFASGISQAELASQYGLGRPAINLIVRRKVWKHLP